MPPTRATPLVPVTGHGQERDGTRAASTAMLSRMSAPPVCVAHTGRRVCKRCEFECVVGRM